MINLSIADYFGFMYLFAQNSLIVALKIFFALQFIKSVPHKNYL